MMHYALCVLGWCWWSLRSTPWSLKRNKKASFNRRPPQPSMTSTHTHTHFIIYSKQFSAAEVNVCGPRKCMCDFSLMNHSLCVHAYEGHVTQCSGVAHWCLFNSFLTMQLYSTRRGYIRRFILESICGGEGAGRAPSPAPEDQSVQVRAVSWLVLVVKRQHGCYLKRKSLKRRTSRRGGWKASRYMW